MSWITSPFEDVIKFYFMTPWGIGQIGSIIIGCIIGYLLIIGDKQKEKIQTAKDKWR